MNMLIILKTYERIKRVIEKKRETHLRMFPARNYGSTHDH